MKYSIKYLLFSGLFALFVFPVHADEDGKNMFNPLTTGVTTLGIAPDARGGSMGDLGVATDPDVNSQYWNPSKYAFAYSFYLVNRAFIYTHDTMILYCSIT